MTAAAHVRGQGRDSGWAGPGVLAMLIFAGVALLGIAVAAPSGTVRAGHTRIAAVQLTDDDGGAALFAARDLVPGRSVARCQRVDYSGPSSPGAVRLAAADVVGPLAAVLNVSVAMGTGGGAAGCAGFAGDPIYHGTLAGLVGGDPQVPGISTGWTPQDGDGRTYRITVTLPETATMQGVTSTATFQWLIVDPAPSSPAPAPVPPASPAPTESPSPSPSASPSPSEAAPVPGPEPGGPPPAAGGATRPKPAPGVPGQRPAKPGKAGKKSSMPAWVPNFVPRLEKLREVVDRSVLVGSKVVTEHGEFPVASLLALGGFLALQGRIDRLDPKLAQAPVWGAQDLPFDEPPGPPDEPLGPPHGDGEQP